MVFLEWYDTRFALELPRLVVALTAASGMVTGYTNHQFCRPDITTALQAKMS